jgi:ComF family protein
MNTHAQLHTAHQGRVRVRSVSNLWACGRQVFNTLLDLLYPPTCGGCGAAGVGDWCAACDARLQRLTGAEQTRTLGLPAPWESITLPVVSLAVYASPLREAIHAFKYDSLRPLAQPLGRLLYEVGASCAPRTDLITPVPLHQRRQRERGYNQSELLAHALGDACGLPVQAKAVQRMRHTHQQALLGVHERRANVRGAFRATPALVRDRRVLLVDDVFTSGATLSECAAALLDAGAQQVLAVTLARAG